jgi:hypothetical protein
VARVREFGRPERQPYPEWLVAVHSTQPAIGDIVESVGDWSWSGLQSVGSATTGTQVAMSFYVCDRIAHSAPP